MDILCNLYFIARQLTVLCANLVPGKNKTEVMELKGFILIPKLKRREHDVVDQL